MREKLQTLPLTELKEIAKAQGIRGLSSMKKADIIEVLCQRAGAEKAEEQEKIAEKPKTEAKAAEHTDKSNIKSENTDSKNAEMSGAAGENPGMEQVKKK